MIFFAAAVCSATAMARNDRRDASSEDDAATTSSDVTNEDEAAPRRGRSGQRQVRGNYRKQRHRVDWETKHPGWHLWLTACPTENTKSYCKICATKLTAKYKVVWTHSLSNKHRNNSEKFERNNEHRRNRQGIQNIRQEVKKFEIRLAAVYAECGYSFLSVKKMSDLINQLPDSAVAKQVKVSQHKVKLIISKVIRPVIHEELRQKLLSQKFSVLIDESTDCSTDSAICICVRYFDEDLAKVTTAMWDFVEIYDDSDRRATGETLWNIVTSSFTTEEIPTANIIGFASDGANNVSGINHSVASRFRDQCSGIFILKCLSHSIHLVAMKAFSELPSEIEAICAATFSYFSKSSLRKQGLIRCQVQVNGEVRRMLKPCRTRWLSFKSCIRRMVENIENGALIAFFTEQVANGDTITASAILEFIKNPLNVAYLQFLDYILRQITS